MRIIIDDDDVQNGTDLSLGAGVYEIAVTLATVNANSPKMKLEVHMDMAPTTVLLPSLRTLVKVAQGDEYYRFDAATWDAVTFPGKVVKVAAHQYIVNAVGELEKSGKVAQETKNIDNTELKGARDPRVLVKERMRSCCYDVAYELAKDQVEDMFAPKGVTTKHAAIDALPKAVAKTTKAIRSLPYTRPKCPECFGTGEWTNPGGGRDATSPCSRGCQKP